MSECVTALVELRRCITRVTQYQLYTVILLCCEKRVGCNGIFSCKCRCVNFIQTIRILKSLKFLSSKISEFHLQNSHCACGLCRKILYFDGTQENSKIFNLYYHIHQRECMTVVMKLTTTLGSVNLTDKNLIRLDELLCILIIPFTSSITKHCSSLIFCTT